MNKPPSTRLRQIHQVTWIIALLLSACVSKELNTKIEIVELTPLEIIPATYRTDRYDYFNANVVIDVHSDTIRFCECSKLLNKVTITFHNGGGAYYDELTVEFAEDSFMAKFKHEGDVRTMDYDAQAIEQALKLNKLNPIPGDTLIGEIDFVGLVIDAYSQVPVDNIHLNGSFICRLKKEKY